MNFAHWWDGRVGIPLCSTLTEVQNSNADSFWILYLFSTSFCWVWEQPPGSDGCDNPWWPFWFPGRLTTDRPHMDEQSQQGVPESYQELSHL